MTLGILAAVPAWQHNTVNKTYYVDYVGGSDSNNGTSTSTPFQHCPGDAAATGTAAATTLAAGNTVAFKGGVTYTGSGTTPLISINVGGTAGSYIVYRGNLSDGSWGTGPAIVDLNASYYSAFKATNKSFIQILNFDFKNAKNSISSASSTTNVVCPTGQYRVNRAGTDQCVTYNGDGVTQGVVLLNGNASSDWVVDNCLFHEFENWSDLSIVNAETLHATDNAYVFAVPLQQACVFFNGIAGTMSNLQVSNCQFYAIGVNGINLQGTSNVQIFNNNFGGINVGPTLKGYFDVAIRLSGTSTKANTGILIRGNTFHDGWQYEGDTGGKDRSHAGDWIHATNSSGPAQSFTIDGNYFYNDISFTQNGGTGFGQLDGYGYGTIIITNNVMINPHAFNGTLVIGVCTFDLLEYSNNTIVCYNGAVGIKWEAATANSKLLNNIIINYGGSSTECVESTTTPGVPGQSDFNVYFTPNGAKAWSYTATQYTLAAWKTFSGVDTNSISSDPLLVSVPTDGSTSSSGNYTLQAGSPCKNSGSNLSAVFVYNFLMQLRSIGGSWNMGAY